MKLAKIFMIDGNSYLIAIIHFSPNLESQKRVNLSKFSIIFSNWAKGIHNSTLSNGLTGMNGI